MMGWQMNDECVGAVVWEQMNKVTRILNSWGKVDRVKFAIWCAERVLPIWSKKYPNDKRPKIAIDYAKNCLDNKVNLDEASENKIARAAGIAGDGAGGRIGSAAHSAGSAAHSASAAVRCDEKFSSFWAWSAAD